MSRVRPSSATIIMSVVIMSSIAHCSPGPPNIVVLMADDIGWDDVGFHGSHDIVTPNLDALAADGVILNSYYTSPLCTPSRAAFLSGVHPIHSGDQHYALVNSEPRGFSLDFPLLPEYLKMGANYSTHLVGKWNLGFFRQVYTPLYRGFDSFFGYYGTKIDYFTHESEYRGMLGLDLRYNLLPARNAKGRYATELFTERAVNLIDGHDTDRPLYLHMAYPNTHCANSKEPLQAPEKYIKKFDYIPDEKRRIYAANLYSFDESVGTIVRALHRRNMLSNTIIAFTSDNGAGDRGTFPNSGSNSPLRGVKGTLWEGALRVPTFVWSPLLKKSSYVHKGHFHVTDWVPTLLEAASISLNGTFRERSKIYGLPQWNSISTGAPSLRSEVLHNIDPIDSNGMAAIRLGDMKLIRGVIHPAISGWYGRSYTSKNLRSATLRETSAARSVLSQLGRKPDYSIFEETIVTCAQPVNSPGNTSNYRLTSNFSGVVSLFNITADPCEQNNLAAQNELLVWTMNSMLEYLAASAVEPLNMADDPNANPALHDRTWVSWGDVQYSPQLSSGSTARIEIKLCLINFLLFLSSHLFARRFSLK